MGSTFDQLMTVEEAASRLNRARRSVYDYLKKGFLTRKVRDGRVLVLREEVEQLAVELSVDLPALTRKNVFALVARVKALEEKMSVFSAMWGAQEETLRPSTKAAADLYRAATDYLCAKEWEIQQLESWATLFNQVGEETLQAIAVATQNTKPWECLFLLAQRMLDFIDSVPASKDVLALKALRAKMDQGRKKVREAALLWIEMGRGSIQADVFRSMDTPEGDVLRRIVKSK
jgi:hypothetical protein